MSETFLPKWIAWEITQRCNLRCIHCRASSEETSAEGDFTTGEALRLLQPGQAQIGQDVGFIFEDFASIIHQSRLFDSELGWYIGKALSVMD